MGKVFEWPSFGELPKREVHEKVRQEIYLKFSNMEEMAKAMKFLKLEDLKKDEQNEQKLFTPDLFGSAQSAGINPKKSDRELMLTFSEINESRGQKIWDYLHEKGIVFNIGENGQEEGPYSYYPESFQEAA